MAVQMQERHGGVLQIENILAENTAAALTLTANGDYVSISGSYENGDIVRITEPAQLAGDYMVTQFDGNDDLGFKVLHGLIADDLSGISGDILGYKIELLPACWVTDISGNLGTWNTEEMKTGCETFTFSTGFERGEVTFNYNENWTIDLQLALKNAFQDNAPSVAVAYIPMGIDENNNKELLGLQETYKALLTGIDFDRPNDGASTGSLTLKLQSKVVTARIA